MPTWEPWLRAIEPVFAPVGGWSETSCPKCGTQCDLSSYTAVGQNGQPLARTKLCAACKLVFVYVEGEVS